MFCYFNTKNIGHLVDPADPAVAVVCHCHVSTYMCLLSFPLQTTSSTRKRRREPLGWSRIVPRLQGITINRDKLILDLGTFAGDDASKFLEITPPVQEVICGFCGIAGWKDIIIEETKKLVSVPTIRAQLYNTCTVVPLSTVTDLYYFTNAIKYGLEGCALGLAWLHTRSKALQVNWKTPQRCHHKITAMLEGPLQKYI